MSNCKKSDFGQAGFDSLSLVQIDFSEWQPYSPGLFAMNSLARARSEFVEVFDLKDKRSGPSASIRVTRQGNEVDEDSDYEAIFEKTIDFYRKAIAGSGVGAEKVAVGLCLEGALISTGGSQLPRPGLRAFLDRLASLDVQVVVYSRLSSGVTDEVLANLCNEGAAPNWIQDCRRVPWKGGGQSIPVVYIVVLGDGCEGYECPGEECCWVEAPASSSQYYGSSKVLQSVLEKIEAVLSGLRMV